MWELVSNTLHPPPLVHLTTVSTSGYEALKRATAWVDGSARGRIWVKGEDRARLLHAMCTNHVQQLQPGQGCYAFFLNPQGRILADANILCRENAFLLDVDPLLASPLYQHLDKYIIADDATLEDAGADLDLLELAGPGAEALLNQLLANDGLRAPAEPNQSILWGDTLVASLSETGGPGYFLFTPKVADDRLRGQLHNAGAVEASTEDLRVVRLENAVPRVGEEIVPLQTLSHETQQTRAIHASKGCYVGQEIVERVRSRGHANKLIVPLEIDGTEVPAVGSKVIASDSEVGELLSAAHSPDLASVVAMAMVRVEPLRQTLALSVAGRPALHRGAAL